LGNAIEYEPRDRHDGARALRDRDELARRHEPPGLRAPADERLDARHAAGCYFDLRLVVDLELVVLNRGFELRLETPQRGVLLSRVGPVDVEGELVLARLLQGEL